MLGAVRLWAIVLTSSLSLMVWGGMKLVSQLGLFFAAVVGLTLASYYAGRAAVPLLYQSLQNHIRKKNRPSRGAHIVNERVMSV